MDWSRVIEEVAFAGPEGLSKDDLISRLKTVFPDYRFDEVTIPMFWRRFCRQPEVSTEAGRSWIRADVRESILLEGRAIKLTDHSRSLLDLIASSGPEGIVQSELGRKTRMDQRNLAHHIKSIHQHGVILRLPVSVKKTFTYLCVLTRWVRSEAMLPIQRVEGTGAEVTVKPAPAQMMRRITELLSSAPDQTLTSKELYEYTGLPQNRGIHKWYRQLLGQLVDWGHVELLLMGGIGGPRSPVYRFKSLHDGLDKVDLSPSQPRSSLPSPSPPGSSSFVPDLHSSQPRPVGDLPDTEGEEEEEDGAAPVGPLLRPFISLDKQARDLIADAGAKGLVLGDLRKALGLNAKAVYRIHTRLTSKKPTSNSDVVKVTEFQGRERRHRLFVEAAQSGPIGPEGPAESKRDSLTRDIRKQCFMKLLMSHDPPIVEANRALGLELGALMAQQSFDNQAKQHAVDNKTIRRVVDQLSQDGLVKQIVIGLSNLLERTLVVPLGMSDDDPQLLMRIQVIKDKPRIYDLSKELADHPLPTVDGHVGIPLEEHKRRLAHFGLVYGTMARAQLVHEYICSRVKPGEVFETPRLMFEELPFGLFLQLASISSVSGELEAFINDKSNHMVCLKGMPQRLHSEITRKRFTAYRRSVRNLLSHLTSLGLIVAVDEHSLRRLNLQIPLMIRLSPVMHVTAPPDARSSKVIALTGPEDVLEYWRLARENWAGQVFEATADLAPVYSHMVLRQSWMTSMPRTQRTLTDAQIDEVARELGVPPEEVRRTMLRPLRKRTIGIMTDLTKTDAQPRKKAKIMAKRPPVSKMVPLAEWSQEDRATAQLIYVLLHDPALQRGQMVNWLLANSLIPNRESTEIRLYLSRAALSDWNWMKQILKLESRVNLVKHVHKVETPACNEDSDDLRAVAFHAYFHHILELLQKDDDRIAEGTGVGPLRTVWRLGKTRLMDEWQRARHYRTPLIQQFDESSYTVPINQDEGLIVPEDAVLKAISAIKMIMTWPGPRYIATVGAQVLADLQPGALKEALEVLLACGFLTKASGGRNRYRVPGTLYALSHRSTALLLTDSSYTGPIHLGMPIDSTTVNTFDFNLFMDMAVSGMVKGEFGLDGEQLSVRLVGSMRDPIAMSLDQLVDLMRGCGVFDDLARTWFWPSSHPLDTSSGPMWHFNSDLFKNALCAVRQAVDQEPAISLASMNSAFWPILGPSEVSDILTCLQSLGLVAHMSGRYFSSISQDR